MWYKILSTKFEGLDFEINPYDRCVAKKIIEGTKCTMAWYADDNKMSHKNPAVISDIINKVKEHFGDLFFLIGNKNIFLDMHIDIKDNIIQFDMVEKFE